ncbi:MAG: hypothetical protein NTV31_10065 [Bacteroidia bacterium]|nr:hypothetical protein [Bacteroidia bacterium]
MKETMLAALKIGGEALLKNFGQLVDFKTKESQSSIVKKADTYKMYLFLHKNDEGE